MGCAVSGKAAAAAAKGAADTAPSTAVPAVPSGPPLRGAILADVGSNPFLLVLELLLIRLKL